MLAARKEILLKYVVIGEIDPEAPLMDAIHCEDSAVVSVNPRAFSESVRSGKVFYPGLGRWNNKDFQDEWKSVDACGRFIRS